MDRETYLQMRRTKQFDIVALYKYYINRMTRSAVDFNTFQQIFPMFLQINIQQITDKLDSEFKVTVLQDENGKEFKFY